MTSKRSPTFVAIDFETADHQPDSACAVGIAELRGGEVLSSHHYLIRPPRREIAFTWVHGISWNDVKNEPTFSQLWPKIASHLRCADYLLAHNASFDRRVLRACCAAANVPTPTSAFICTVTVARKVWSLYPTKLPDVARHLGLALKHHDAGSDARVCAEIGRAALRQGATLELWAMGG